MSSTTSYQIFKASKSYREIIADAFGRIGETPIRDRNFQWYQRTMRMDSVESRSEGEIWVGVFATIAVGVPQNVMSEFEEGIEKTHFGAGKGLGYAHGALYHVPSGLLMLERHGSGKLISRFARYIQRYQNKEEVEDLPDPVMFTPLFSKDTLKQLARFRAKSLRVKVSLEHEPQLAELFFAKSADFIEAVKAGKLEPTLDFRLGVEEPAGFMTKLGTRIFKTAQDSKSFDAFVLNGKKDEHGKSTDTIKLTTFPMQKSLGKADFENIQKADGDVEQIKNNVLYAWNKYEGELKKDGGRS